MTAEQVNLELKGNPLVTSTQGIWEVEGADACKAPGTIYSFHQAAASPRAGPLL